MEEKNLGAIANIEKYHKARVLKLIIDSMGGFITDIFYEIENVYECGEEIPQKDVDKLVNEIRRGIDTIESYLC